MGELDRYAQYPAFESEGRVRFFDGQFLNSQDFIDEQRYHVDRLRRHVRALHVRGISGGLEVAAVAPMRVSVAPGTGIDHVGRMLVVRVALTYTLPGDTPRPGEYVLCAAYAERGDRTLGGTAEQPGSRGDTRIAEEVALSHVPREAPIPPDRIGLAVLSLDNAGSVTVRGPADVRVYSGLRLEGPGGVGPTLTTSGEANPTELVVGEHLRVRGRLTLDEGVVQSPGTLTMAWGQSPLRLSSGWTSYPDDTSRFFGAEISNDTAGFKALMIVGNASAGAGRRVAVWDTLGIGTSTPGAKLSLGNDGANTKLAVWDGGGGALLGLGVQSAQFRLHLDAPSSRFSFLDGPAGRELVTILGSGRLGVGRSPELPLDVAGLARAGEVVWGNADTRTMSRDNAGLRGDAGARSGFFETAGPVNYPAGAQSWWHLVDVRHSNPGNNFALQIAGSFYDQRLFFRKTNNDPATPWRRLLSIDDIAVSADGKAGIGVGRVGVSAPAPVAHLDVAQAGRVGAHPAAVKGLYVTGDFLADRDGVEFRHTNGTQGVGIGYAGVYATGSNADQNLGLFPRGGGGVGIGALDPGGKLDVRVPGVGGWDRFVVTTSTGWDGANQHVTIGAGGAAGVMMNNPHVVWLPSEARASLRYAPTGADAAKPWWDVGARGDGAFTVAVTNSLHALRVEANGNVGVCVKPEPANRLQIAGGHLHLDGGSLLLRKGAGDQFNLVKWNPSTDRVDVGGWAGTTLGVTSDAGANAVTPVLEVTKGRVDMRVAGDGGWDRLVVTATKLWNSVHSHVTLGAGGMAGLMLHNPHVVWVAGEARASIRYAHTNADANLPWWDVGARGDGAFTLAVTNSVHALRVESNGNVGIGVKPEAANRLQINGGHLHLDGGSLLLRKGAGDQFNLVRWNPATDRIDVGGWNGVTLGTTVGGPNAVTPVLEVTKGRLDVQVGGDGGWDRLVVTPTNLWNSVGSHVTLGAGGMAGLMLNNPHVVWNAGEARASIRYAHTNADASKPWWDVGARGDGAFTIAVTNSLHALRVEPSGNVAVTGRLSATVNGRALTEQMVHRRVILGLAGDGPVGFDSGAGSTIRFCYGPFGYAVPPVQAGATRRFRIYAIYSDNMTSSGEIQVSFRLTTDWGDNGGGGVYTFTLDRTWGDPAHNRDCYSPWFVGQPPGHHGFVRIRTTAGGTVGRIYYLELQAWDVF